MVRILRSAAVRAETQKDEFLKGKNSLFTQELDVPEAASMLAAAQNCAKIAVPGPCLQLACSQ